MIRTVTIQTCFILLAATAAFSIEAWAVPSQMSLQIAGQAQSSTGQTQVGDGQALIIPAGTPLNLAVTTPVWAKTAKVGDPIYTQTNFPVTVGGRIAIPPGTYVEGTLEAVTRPTRKVKRAELEVALTKIIFANGYAIALTADSAGVGSGAEPVAAGMGATVANVTAANVTVQVTTANDLLLDNGAQIQMTLAAPLSLDEQRVASAIPLTRALTPGEFKTATLCRNVAATSGFAGTPNTVIPGSAGTPSISIPGGPGMPATVIPGTPATPDTVIPGSPGVPGTPGYYCPAPPMVISSSPPT